MFDQVIDIDTEKRTVRAQPRVSMKKLVQTIHSYGLTIPVVPELKGITVGGAIMGVGGESASHRWGVFGDMCTSFEMILGDGAI